MEWIVEGLALCFIGILVFLVTVVSGHAVISSLIVVRSSALMLVVLAVVSFFTGARISIMPMKLCPYVKIAVAALFVLGGFF